MRWSACSTATASAPSPWTRPPIATHCRPRLLDELAQALRDATTDAEVRALVLTGTGTVFCSGADLSERGSRCPHPHARDPDRHRREPGPRRRPRQRPRAGGRHRSHRGGRPGRGPGRAPPSASARSASASRPAMILVPALRVADRRFLARAVLTGEPFTAGEAAAAGLLTAVLEDVAALDDWVGTQTRVRAQVGARRGRRHQGAAALAAGPGVDRRARGGGGRVGRRSSPVPRRPRAWTPSSRSASRRGTRRREHALRTHLTSAAPEFARQRGRHARPGPTRCVPCTTRCWPAAGRSTSSATGPAAR